MAFKLSKVKRPEGIGKLQETGKSGAGATRIPFIGVIGKMPINRKLQLLGSALLVFLLLAVAAAYLDNRAASNGTRYVVESSKLLMLSQRMAKAAERSLSGDYLAFEELTQSREQEISILTLLDKGDSSLPATGGAPRMVLNELTKLANKTLADIIAVEEGRPGLVTLARAIVAIDAAAQELRSLTQQLVARSEGVHKERAVRFSLLVERIAKDAASMLGDITPAQVGVLGVDTIEAGEVLKTFPADDPLIISITDLFDSYRISAEAIIGNAQNLLGAKRAGRAIFDDSQQLLEQSQKLADTYQASLSNRFTSYVMAASGVMVLMLLMLLAKVYLDDSRRRALEAEQANRRNQDAILRLMNEMGRLADGDLTVRATVSEDITGAIADSVNYTIEELRVLVGRINSAAEQVTGATGSAYSTSARLLEAAEQQSRQIQDTSASGATKARIPTASGERRRSISPAPDAITRLTSSPPG